MKLIRLVSEKSIILKLIFLGDCIQTVTKVRYSKVSEKLQNDYSTNGTSITVLFLMKIIISLT